MGWNYLSIHRSQRCNRYNFIPQFIMVATLRGDPLCITVPLRGEPTGRRWIPLTKASDAELWWFSWSLPRQTVWQTVEWSVIWDVTMVVVMDGSNYFNRLGSKFSHVNKQTWYCLCRINRYLSTTREDFNNLHHFFMSWEMTANAVFILHFLKSIQPIKCSKITQHKYTRQIQHRIFLTTQSHKSHGTFLLTWYIFNPSMHE